MCMYIHTCAPGVDVIINMLEYRSLLDHCRSLLKDSRSLLDHCRSLLKDSRSHLDHCRSLLKDSRSLL